jgi:hypothetical protein
MARIRLLDNDEFPSAERQGLIASEAAGRDTTTQRALAHRQDMFDRYFDFYYYGHEHGVVEPELKELVRLKIARLNDCFT